MLTLRGDVSIRVNPDRGEIAVVGAIEADSPFALYLVDTYLVVTRTAARLHLIERGRSTNVIATSDGPLTSAQITALNRIDESDLGAQLSTARRDVYVNFTYDRGLQRAVDLQRLTYQVILPTALVLAFLTALVGLALTAAETRDEQATLVAVGAGPRRR